MLKRCLESQGVPTLWIHPYRGEAYPTLAEISGMVSLGGPMSANDEEIHPWIRTETALLAATAREGLPVAGICLGGQMLARGLGGKVERNRVAEIGWFPLEVLPTGRLDPVLGAAGVTPSVYQWHEDTFQLPPGGELLARSENCERQAYRWGDRAYGFQFHPEADHQLVHEWLSIEGVDDEIRLARKIAGAATVQQGRTQRARARQGERASLKITAAIGSLFRVEPTPPVDEDFRQTLKEAAANRALLLLDSGLHRLRGRIAFFLFIPAGEFVIFEEENTLLWPIRLEDIRSLAPLA